MATQSDQSFALEAEQAVIRAILEDPAGDVLSQLRMTLQAADFYTLVFRKIFEAACWLLDEGGKTPSPAIVSMLRSQGVLDDSSMPQVEAAYMAPLSLANLPDYVKLITEKSRGRAIKSAVSGIVDRVRLIGAGATSDDILLELENLPQQFEREDTSEVEILEKPVVKAKRAMEWLEKFNDGVVSPVYMGIDSIDEKTDGHLPGDLVIIAGRPGMGKTAFAMNWLLDYSVPTLAEMVKKVEKPISAFFSLEMGDIALVLRSLANLSGIDNKRIRKSMMTDSEFETFTRAVQQFVESSLHIDTAGSLDISQLRSKLLQLKRANPGKKIGLVVIDYLQLMEAVRPSSNRNNDVTEISRGLKKLAKEFDCVIAALSQLSREVEKRANKRPVISDLRESGAIEQDADAIYLLYRDEYYNPDTDQKGLIEVNNAKKRDGNPCVCLAQFDPSIQRFKSPPHYVKESMDAY